MRIRVDSDPQPCKELRETGLWIRIRIHFPSWIRNCIYFPSRIREGKIDGKN